MTDGSAHGWPVGVVEVGVNIRCSEAGASLHGGRDRRAGAAWKITADLTGVFDCGRSSS